MGVERSKRVRRILKKFGGSEDIDAKIDDIFADISSGKDPAEKLADLKNFHSLTELVDQFEKVIQSLEEKEQTAKKNLELSTRDLSKSNLQLTEINNLVDVMLSSIEEAYFLFGKDGVCSDFSSAKCEELLGMTPNNKKLTEVLNISDELFDKWLFMLFESPLEFFDAAKLGPPEIKREGEHISLEYFPISKDEDLQQVVVVAKDITKEKLVEQQTIEMNERSNILLSIQKSKLIYDSFLKFLNEGLKDFIEAKPESSSVYDQFYMFLHTAKGTMFTLSMNSLGQIVHEMEEELKNSLRESVDEDIIQAAKKLQTIVKEYLKRNEDVFAVLKEDSLSICKKSLIAMANDLQQETPHLCQTFCQKFLMIDLSAYFEDLNDFLQEIASKNSKNILYTIENDEEVLIFDKRFEDLLLNLNHIFTNAIVHGIEDSSERVNLSKTEYGNIKVSCQKKLDKLEIKISDDGQGIDIEKIATKKGINVKDCSKEDIIEFIFDKNMSTLDEANLLAGRGIGLSSLKLAIEELNGKIEVQTEKSKGTDFIISIPLLTFKEEFDFYQTKEVGQWQ